MLKAAPEDMLQMWPVSRKVNRVGNESDPTLRCNPIESWSFGRHIEVVDNDA
jgi:hypothetical protein